MINSTNNTFILEENSIQTQITLPIGNYNRISLKNVLETVLNDLSPSTWTYLISYDNAWENIYLQFLEMQIFNQNLFLKVHYLNL